MISYLESSIWITNSKYVRLPSLQSGSSKKNYILNNFMQVWERQSCYKRYFQKFFLVKIITVWLKQVLINL